ncbi:MAG: hypothetical protein HN348_35905, partial [Proteobacteria bacterium]|nr:hypothetical protein [Pseudomonadota bacterium]
ERAVAPFHTSLEKSSLEGSYLASLHEGDKFHAISSTVREDRTVLHYRRFNATSGKVVDERLLDTETWNWVGLSANGRHVLVSFTVKDPGKYRYDATLYRLSDGQAIRTFESLSYGGPFVVRDGVLIQRREERSADLVATDLVQGNTLWTIPLRQTRYDGPFPP